MEGLWIALAVLYFGAGLAVYALTDTRGFAYRVEQRLIVVPLRVLQENVFLFVVALWPLWLALVARSPRA